MCLSTAVKLCHMFHEMLDLCRSFFTGVVNWTIVSLYSNYKELGYRTLDRFLCHCSSCKPLSALPKRFSSMWSAKSIHVCALLSIFATCFMKYLTFAGHSSQDRLIEPSSAYIPITKNWDIGCWTSSYATVVLYSSCKSKCVALVIDGAFMQKIGILTSGCQPFAYFSVHWLLFFLQE